MKITHLNNSFIVINGGGTTLACDPWTGTSNYGTWHAIPIYEREDIAEFLADVDYVYISHLHADHLDPETLRYGGLLDCPFVINKNRQPTLRNRLSALGVPEIIECEPFTPVNLDDLTVATVPQMSGYSDTESEIDYDLDSSLIVTDHQSVFFNQVDNPLSPKDMGAIASWTRDNFGDIDLAAVTCGAASEYPQCFMNLDRGAEKERVEVACIELLQSRLEQLGPKNIFLAGGSYFIPGRFSALNEYIAVPSPGSVEAAVREFDPNIGFLRIEGGTTAEIAPDGDVSTSNGLNPLFLDLKDALTATTDIPYAQDEISLDGLDAEIDRVLPLATKALKQQLDRLGARIKAQLVFALHDRLTLDNSGELVSVPTRRIELDVKPELPDHELMFHMDKSLFAGAISGRMVWNLIISGSQIMYERHPNVFHPTDTGALNFFVHREPNMPPNRSTP